jgi:Fic family protein
MAPILNKIGAISLIYLDPPYPNESRNSLNNKTFYNFAIMKIQEINKLADIYQRLSKGMIDHDKYTYYAITHHSTAIEGSTLTEKQAVTVLGTYDTAKGDFRLGSVRAGNRAFPDFKKVPAMVKQLCENVNKEIKTAATFEQRCNLAFKVHFDFVSIHPLGDGNGRDSRLLMNYIQARFKLPLSVVFKQDRLKYIAALESARNKADITLFYKFMYDQYAKFLKMEIDLLNDSPGERKKGKPKA